MLGKADDTAELEKQVVIVHDVIKNCESELQGCYSDISSNVRTGLRDIIEAIRNLLSDKTDEIIVEIKRLLRGQEKVYAGIVSSVIMANLKQNLAHEQKKRENLLARLNSSEQERDLRIAALTERSNELEIILSKAVALKDELEKLKVD